jgi:Zn-dependent M28 family amino/carboxypeptidase
MGLMLVTLASCGKNPEKAGVALITEQAIRPHLAFLASDQLEGRGTGTKGEKLAAEYIADQLQSAGVAPGGENGTFFQKVPIINYTAVPPVRFQFVKGNSKISLVDYGEGFVANTGRAESRVAFNKEIVYVGYGIVAPEQNWDDYKGVDVKDKVLLMLVNDPPSDDPNFFGGKALTYYGRWTYKYEIAGEKGAAGVILIHTDEKAGYGWQVVRNSWTGTQSMLTPKPGDPPHSRIEGWITRGKAEELFRLAGYKFDEMIEKAGKPDFKPVSLAVNLNADVKSTIAETESQNVVGIVKGRIADEYIVYTSHHDHLGIGNPVKGDSIYNGARDNASGCAALLDIANTYAHLPKPPARSILFLFVTAEERGLLGSKYYAQNPLYPLNKTLANLNLDMISFLGRFMDVTLLGAERTNLMPLGEKLAKEYSLTVVPDQTPEQGHFFRSDHFSLAKAGIPAVNIQPGSTIEEHPSEWGKEQVTKYRNEMYHQPSDEYPPDANLAGVEQIARFTFQLGYRIAGLKEFPVWNEGEQFKKIRDESLKGK